MRALGLDFGDKTIGVAVSDALNLTAQGVTVIRRALPLALNESIQRLGELITRFGVTDIILGYPKLLNNTEGERCRKTQVFKSRLQREFPGVNITLWDERLSTVAAGRSLNEAELSKKKRGALIDMMAAVFILQGWLDASNKKKRLTEHTLQKITFRRRSAKKMDDFKDDEFKDDEFGDDFDVDDEFDFEDEVELISLTDDDGEEKEFVIIDAVEYNNDNYVLLVPSDEFNSEEADAVILKEVSEDLDGDSTFEDPTDEEFEAVSKLFKERENDEFDLD